MRSDFKELDKNKKVLITGAAGFIGFHLSKILCELGVNIIGFDNLNDYYDISLKESRLNILADFSNFKFIKGDLSDKNALQAIFSGEKPDIVVNLGAQAGVRYSIENPDAYMQSNMVGFLNILECCRHFPVDHLIYASSSSVYGANKKIPFSTTDNVDNPVSLYAATKKSNELMAYTYSHLYNIPSTGLRFFTVYGPYGRPDMAYFSFTKKIIAGEEIPVFNNGDMYRDFTYIDDIVTAITKMLCNPPLKDETGVKYKVYNIGNSSPEKLSYFVETLEKHIGQKANIKYLPMQPGDVLRTFADVSDLEKDFDFRPNTSLDEGLRRFVEWYKEDFKEV